MYRLQGLQLEKLVIVMLMVHGDYVLATDSEFGKQ